MGILTDRLRAYEKGDDLLRLVKKRMNKKFKVIRDKIAKYLFITGIFLIIPPTIVLIFRHPSETVALMGNFFLIFGFGLIGSSTRAKFIGRDLDPDKDEEKLKNVYYKLHPIIIAVLSVLILATLTHFNYIGWVLYASSMSIGFIVGALGLRALEIFNRY